MRFMHTLRDIAHAFISARLRQSEWCVNAVVASVQVFLALLCAFVA